MTPLWKQRARKIGHRLGIHPIRATDPDSIARFERSIPRLRLSSGVNRTTFGARFRALDEFVNQILSRRFRATARLAVEDWAASDCLTSSEWASTLLARFPEATFTASDLTLFLIEVCLPDGSSYVIEPNAEPVHYIRRPFAIRLNAPEPPPLLINSLLVARARARYRTLRPSLEILREWLESDDEDSFSRPPLLFRKIPLIHPHAEDLRRSSRSFAIRHHSAFEPSSQPCDVIRTMNIFNFAYFPEKRLLEGARAVRASLREAGIWIVGRTIRENPPLHDASIFELHSAGFRLLERFGAGSEIEQFVLAEPSLENRLVSQQFR